VSGRAASLPQPGYRLPQRVFAGVDECRVVCFPEIGGEPVVVDLSILPVSRELREWMALGVAGATGPDGTRRTASSALDTAMILLRFCRYLATLNNAPRTPADLRAVHVDGFILLGGKSLHRDLPALRSVLRHAPNPPAEFWARLSQARAPKTDEKVRGYSEAEFTRIAARAKADLRAAAARIGAGRARLAAWRGGLIDQNADPEGWTEGELLDYVDRHGDVPRCQGKGGMAWVVVQHGGSRAVMARLFPTLQEVGAAAVLLICLTGQNYSTIAKLTVEHSRPDGHAGGPASALVEMVKPRRGSRRTFMDVALQNAGAAAGDRLELDTPFGVFTLMLDLTGRARELAGSASPFAHYNTNSPNGRGFRQGLSRPVLQFWGYSAGLVCDEPDPGSGAPIALHIDGRRLRLTWLELHQKPVAHTEATLANEYLARNQGNLAEYRQVVAKALEDQVAQARSRPPIPVLSAEDVALAEHDPATVATRYGISADTLRNLIARRLDTVLAGCADHTAGPFTAPGSPCEASFLLCLSCPCARALPTHLPVQVLVHDALAERREAMTPLRWAQRFAGPHARLTDLLARFPHAVVTDARTATTETDRALVERFLNRELDQR
jgi:hypothetical protein